MIARCLVYVLVWTGCLAATSNALVWCKISLEKNALSPAMVQSLNPVVIKALEIPLVAFVSFFVLLVLLHLYVGTMSGFRQREKILVLLLLLGIDVFMLIISWTQLVVPLQSYIHTLKSALQSYSQG